VTQSHSIKLHKHSH